LSFAAAAHAAAARRACVIRGIVPAYGHSTKGDSAMSKIVTFCCYSLRTLIHCAISNP